VRPHGPAANNALSDTGVAGMAGDSLKQSDSFLQLSMSQAW
jgi:hypothetical protein